MKHEKTRSTKNTILTILIILFACVALFSAYKLISAALEYKKGRDIYSGISGNVIIPDTSGLPGSPDETDKPKEDNFRRVNFEELKKISSNAIGWIYCPDTHIDYPLVQGPDNDYYLRRAVDGSDFLYGSIFLDYRNAPDFSDANTIIYGHQSNDGAMFEDVRKFKDQAFYEEHPYFYLTLEDGNYLMEVFSSYVTSAVSASYRRTFATADDHQIWLDMVISSSDIKTGIKPTQKDRIVTLSTCTYEYENARYVLHGRLVKLEDE